MVNWRKTSHHTIRTLTHHATICNLFQLSILNAAKRKSLKKNRVPVMDFRMHIRCMHNENKTFFAHAYTLYIHWCRYQRNFYLNARKSNSIPSISIQVNILLLNNPIENIIYPSVHSWQCFFLLFFFFGWHVRIGK